MAIYAAELERVIDAPRALVWARRLGHEPLGSRRGARSRALRLDHRGRQTCTYRPRPRARPRARVDRATLPVDRRLAGRGRAAFPEGPAADRRVPRDVVRGRGRHAGELPRVRRRGLGRRRHAEAPVRARAPALPRRHRQRPRGALRRRRRRGRTGRRAGPAPARVGLRGGRLGGRARPPTPPRSKVPRRAPARDGRERRAREPPGRAPARPPRRGGRVDAPVRAVARVGPRSDATCCALSFLRRRPASPPCPGR
jgi:hypothetical protein